VCLEELGEELLLFTHLPRAINSRKLLFSYAHPYALGPVLSALSRRSSTPGAVPLIHRRIQIRSRFPRTLPLGDSVNRGMVSFPTCRRRPTPWPPSFFCPAGVGGVTFLGEQRNLHDSAPYNAFVRRVSCCNRAATGAGHARTEQENNGARNAKNCLSKPNFRQGSTYPESIDLTYKEEVAGSNPASPTSEKQ
jgi:hypothetical protein